MILSAMDVKEATISIRSNAMIYRRRIKYYDLREWKLKINLCQAGRERRGELVSTEQDTWSCYSATHIIHRKLKNADEKYCRL
jgi:hypothetical protein